MASSPDWALSENISDIRLRFPDEMEGKQLPAVHIDIYKYNDHS